MIWEAATGEVLLDLFPDDFNLNVDISHLDKRWQDGSSFKARWMSPSSTLGQESSCSQFFTTSSSRVLPILFITYGGTSYLSVVMTVAIGGLGY